MRTPEPCPVCDGQGTLEDINPSEPITECHECEGKGHDHGWKVA